jgi:hypothetical protein
MKPPPEQPPDARELAEELLETLVEVVNQTCTDDDGSVSSLCLSAYADAIELLARLGRVEITQRAGRGVKGRWTT